MSAHRPVRVAGVEIPERAIAAEMQHHPAADAAGSWEAAARALVVRELLLHECDRQGLRAEPARDGDGRAETPEEARIRVLLERELELPEADEASCRRYYAANPARFMTPTVFAASHILFAARHGDHAAYASATAEAAAALVELLACPDRFAALARERSACPSAAQGGSLGQIGPGDTTPEFESALHALEPGQLCPVPIKTRYGVHVIRLDRRAPGRLLPFETVHARIAAFLTERAWHTAARQYLRLLAGRVPVEGMELDAAPTPLMQ